MRFLIQTLVDITETNARRGQDKHLLNQQANYNTVLQTIGLRANIEPVSLTNSVVNINGIGFGTNYKGDHMLWEFTFLNPYEGALTLEMLKHDFNLVPVISQLDESVNLDISIFDTQNTKSCNIVFTEIDK